MCLLECTVQKLIDPNLRDCISNDSNKECVRAHYLLHELGKILQNVSKSISQCKGVDEAMKMNLVSAAPFE